MSAPDPLAAFRAADSPYQHALEELRALAFARDQALLHARRAGLDDASLCAATGLDLDALRASLARAVDAEAGEDTASPGPAAADRGAVTLTAIYEPDEGGWIQARLLEWPGVITAGRTRDEARALLRDAAREWLRSLSQEGPCPPAGERSDRESLEVLVR